MYLNEWLNNKPLILTPHCVFSSIVEKEVQFRILLKIVLFKETMYFQKNKLICKLISNNCMEMY